MKKALAVRALPAHSAWAQASASPKIATPIGLAPPQSYVHIFCDKDEGVEDCVVAFRCHGCFEAVTWTVDVEPGLFNYWPGNTDSSGNDVRK